VRSSRESEPSNGSGSRSLGLDPESLLIIILMALTNALAFLILGGGTGSWIHGIIVPWDRCELIRMDLLTLLQELSDVVELV